MKTIIIAEGITATVTERTYCAIQTYYKESEKLNRWICSAINDHDWGDMYYYYNLQDKLEQEYEWLWK